MKDNEPNRWSVNQDEALTLFGIPMSAGYMNMIHDDYDALVELVRTTTNDPGA